MKPIRRLLIGTDFTAESARAAGRGVRLPLAARAHVALLHVAPRVPSRDFGAAVGRAAREALDRQAAGLRRGRAPAFARLEEVLAQGAAAEAMVREAHGRNAELMVVGPRGRPGLPDLELGSTAERLLAESDVPVLLVRRAARHAYRHVLVAMDLGRSSSGALSLALRLVEGEGRRVTLLHVLESPAEAALRMAGASDEERGRWRDRERDRAERFLDAEANRVLRAGVEVEFALADGDAREEVLAAARRLRVDLVALGTRRGADRAGLLIGSVARWVARRAPCDVLVARARPARRRETVVVPAMKGPR